LSTQIPQSEPLAYAEPVLPSEGEPRKIGQALSKVVKPSSTAGRRASVPWTSVQGAVARFRAPAISVEGLLEAAKPAMTREETTR
jgi:hypothetical protein